MYHNFINFLLDSNLKNSEKNPIHTNNNRVLPLKFVIVKITK